MKVNGSMAHTVGNVTFQITELIKELFKKDFFRHVHIDSRIVFRENKTTENNSRREFIKKNRPILAIRPKVDLNNTDIFLTHSLMTNNLYNEIFTGDTSNFIGFFRDLKNKIGISYLPNRIRVLFEVTILLDTEIQQLNIYNFLLNTLINERVYYLKTALENYIPSRLIEYVSMFSGIPIVNEKGNCKTFLDYMNSNSNKWVTVKESTANSLKEFYMYYPLNIEWVPTDINIDDPAKKGFVTQSANITFTITTEFNTVGLYAMFYSDALKTKAAYSDQTFISANDNTNIIPYFTINNLFDSIDINGWKLFYYNMIICDKDADDPEPETLDMNQVFGDGKTFLPELLEYHRKQGMPYTLIFNIILMKNNEKLSDEEDPETKYRDYYFNFDEMKLYIYNKDPDATYRLVIYVNELYINNLSNNLNNLDSVYEQPYGKDASGRSRRQDRIGK